MKLASYLSSGREGWQQGMADGGEDARIVGRRWPEVDKGEMLLEGKGEDGRNIERR